MLKTWKRVLHLWRETKEELEMLQLQFLYVVEDLLVIVDSFLELQVLLHDFFITWKMTGLTIFAINFDFTWQFFFEFLFQKISYRELNNLHSFMNENDMMLNWCVRFKSWLLFYWIQACLQFKAQTKSFL